MDTSDDRKRAPVVDHAAREAAAAEASQKSKKENRVYVGNLSFGVKYDDLKDFMSEGGSFFHLFSGRLDFGSDLGLGLN